MATVTMDNSEYELLKENIRLLEESKKRENELSKEVEKLQDEKIKALEESSNSVSIINKTIETQGFYLKENPKVTFDKLRAVLPYQEALMKENKLHEELATLHYRPKIKFDGSSTECFTNYKI